MTDTARERKALDWTEAMTGETAFTREWKRSILVKEELAEEA